MPVVNTNPWVPLYTAGIGYAVGLVTMIATHFLTSGRERQARRVEFQRKTLTELQDTVAKLQRFTAASTQSAQGPSLESLITPEYGELQHSLSILTTRLKDEQLRRLTERVRVSSARIVMARSHKEAAPELHHLADTAEAALERAGNLLIDIV